MPESILDKRKSLILRGGICTMLIHHLFYSTSSTQLYDDIFIGSHGIVNEIGIFCKICVAIFVFLSGYGLASSVNKENLSIPQFYLKRFKKLYLNYWFIYLIFVPIGVFVFNRGFQEVYGNYQYVKAILEFFGLYNAFGGLGYNPTWWFYSCIIVLYILFPIIIKYLTEKPIIIATSCICVSVLGFLPILNPIRSYLLPFVVGILMAYLPVNKLKKISTNELLASLAVLSLSRLIGGQLNFIIDTLICVALALLISKCNADGWLANLFVSLGKHSMNIFLFHTFIFYYWFKDYIYITRNPLLIFLELIIVCYIISLILEFIKRKTGFYRLLQ